MHDGRWIDNGPWRVNRFSVNRPHLGDLLNDFVVEFFVDSKAVVKNLSTVEDLIQLAVKLGRGKCFVCAKVTLRTFNARTPAIPDLSFWITRPDKERVLFFVARSDHCN